ncbi:MAG: glycosyltransferase family 2 protein [Planctomycetaceae bacterium]|nr:glycosyltransferase family 2 protein [Planctomycetaceae bacterium]
MNALPPCDYRGAQVAPDRWRCTAPMLVVPGGIVSSATCAICPHAKRRAAMPAPHAPPANGAARAALDRVAIGGPANDWPLVTCVMPTRDRPEFACLAVRCFLRQDYSAKELIVLDDGTQPLPVTWGQNAPVRLIRLAPCTIGEKRNLGCREARGSIVMQWDDDDWCGAGRIRRQIEPLAARRADISGLVLTPVFDLPRFEFWQPSLRSFQHLSFAGVHCGTLAYRREVCERFTRYPLLSMGEDVGFLRPAIFAGCRIAGVAAHDDFIYVRHGRNTWNSGEPYRQFGSRQIAPPAALLPELAHYRRLQAQSLGGGKSPALSST